MIEPRVQLRRVRGWQMPPDAKKIDRGTRWGNPFRITGPVRRKEINTVEWRVEFEGRHWSFPTEAEARAAAVRFYRQWIWLPHNRQFRDEMRQAFEGKRPACWCGLAKPCHGDPMIEIINSPLECQAA